MASLEVKGETANLRVQEGYFIMEKPMKHWAGLFEPPNTILLKNTLTPKQREATLKHELKHFNFYLKHRWLGAFFHLKFRVFYYTAMFTVLCFSSLAYLVLLIPPSIMVFHEVHVSYQTRSWKRIAECALSLYIFCLLFFALPNILKFLQVGSP